MKQIMVFIAAFIMISGCLSQPLSSNGNDSGTITVPVGQNDSIGANDSGNGTILPAQNQSADDNQSAIVDDNATIIPDDPQNELPVYTNKTLDQLLSDGLDKLPGPEGSGPFFISSQTWKTNEYDDDPGTISVIFNPTNMVLFDNKSDQNLVGFAFKTYKPNSGKTTSNGLIIVYGASAILDNHMAFNPAFDIDYTGIGQPKKLAGAQITNRQEIYDNKNRMLVIYNFDYAIAE